MLWKLRQTGKAVWKYLNQPLFEPNSQTYWKINKFWQAYQIQLLENCWQKDCSSQSHYTQ